MDPITQGTLGALAPQFLIKARSLLAVGVIGFLAGLAPDLDVLIRSDINPLLSLEFHRHFTHSIFFVPFGASICATIFYVITRYFLNISFGVIWLACFIGYGTHGLLDSCTSYGTLLFWPLSNERVAWNILSIIDPLFTLPLLLFVILAAITQARKFAIFGVIWMIGYLSIAYFQQQRAVSFAEKLAVSRNHDFLRVEAKPSFGNVVLWKTIYETEESFHVDAVRPLLNVHHFKGESVKKLDIARDFPWLLPDSQQYKDVQKFAWFSNNYLAVMSSDSDGIGDIRYSMLPHKVEPLWLIKLDSEASSSQHVTYEMNRSAVSPRLNKLVSMIFD